MPTLSSYSHSEILFAWEPENRRGETKAMACSWVAFQKKKRLWHNISFPSLESFNSPFWFCSHQHNSSSDIWPATLWTPPYLLLFNLMKKLIDLMKLF